MLCLWRSVGASKGIKMGTIYKAHSSATVILLKCISDNGLQLHFLAHQIFVQIFSSILLTFSLFTAHDGHTNRIANLMMAFGQIAIHISVPLGQTPF
jgi:hypothetical protein